MCFTESTGGNISKADLHEAVLAIEVFVGFNKRRADVNPTDFIKRLYKFTHTYAPEFVRGDTETIKTSQKQFKAMKAGFSREEISEANNLIAMLAEGGAGAPRFDPDPTSNPDYAGGFRPDTNTISLNMKDQNRDSLPSLVYIDARGWSLGLQKPDDRR